MNPRIEYQIVELQQFLTDNLSLIKRTFGPASKEVWEKTIVTLSPNLTKVKKTVGH